MVSLETVLDSTASVLVPLTTSRRSVKPAGFLYTKELDMREILWALIAVPILYVLLWLLMAAF